ncbi:MAG: hypothetical protein JST92_02150 [Deltaproteobacteria bacterium]|nr:hypothetical protein [Deltaproteobacteria bacterium]
MADGKTQRSIGRRALLVGGGGVMAAAALSGGYLLSPIPRLPGRKLLTATEAKVGLAIYETLFDEPGAPTAAQTDFLGRFDEMLGLLHPQTRTAFRAGLRALDLATIPSMGSRFHALDVAGRKAALRAWEHSSYLWTNVVMGFRITVAQMFFESDEGRAACGWSLGCVPSGREG